MNANSNRTNEASNTSNNSKQKSPQNGAKGWSKPDKEELLKAFIVLSNLASTYGKTIDPKAMLEHFEWVMADEYTMAQILPALRIHSKKTDTFPTPSAIIEIINPPKPKITTAQYIAAKEWQKRNQNWSRFESEAILIAEYERENSEARSEWDRNQQALANQNTGGNIEFDNDDLLIGGC